MSKFLIFFKKYFKLFKDSDGTSKMTLSCRLVTLPTISAFTRQPNVFLLQFGNEKLCLFSFHSFRVRFWSCQKVSQRSFLRHSCLLRVVARWPKSEVGPKAPRTLNYFEIVKSSITNDLTKGKVVFTSVPDKRKVKYFFGCLSASVWRRV